MDQINLDGTLRYNVPIVSMSDLFEVEFGVELPRYGVFSIVVNIDQLASIVRSNFAKNQAHCDFADPFILLASVNH